MPCCGPNRPARVSYVHSERFVGDMVKGLQHNTIAEFKRSYRSLDALLIDDIQFFAGKERSQEEFFHTFNALLEGQKQISPDLRPLPEGSEWPRRAAEVAVRLGPDRGHRAAGTRNIGRHPDEQGGVGRRGVA